MEASEARASRGQGRGQPLLQIRGYPRASSGAAETDFYYLQSQAKTVYHFTSQKPLLHKK